ncbi:MAG TPA: hypothetical protein VK619_19035 [Pyrinomonadaceae bacterium]|nr:hypothetical protein [Pyrinomonadaceae bacterium]
MQFKSRAFRRSSFINLFAVALIFIVSVTALSQNSQPAPQPAASAQSSSAAQTRTPTETVREFYRMLRERHFREAFSISIYKPAIEGLSDQEFDDLRPEFERMASVVPDNITISGEQVSGDTATVFVKASANPSDTTQQPEPLTLIRSNGQWIIGDHENEQVVKQGGKRFFFDARINAHHSDMQSALQSVLEAELKYSIQHGGQFGNLQELVAAGHLTQESIATEAIGYNFQFTVASDRKTFTGHAEPQRYGQTGRLSFTLDNSGIRSADVNGRQLNLPANR